MGSPTRNETVFHYKLKAEAQQRVPSALPIAAGESFRYTLRRVLGSLRAHSSVG